MAEKIKILILEDNPHDARFLQEYFFTYYPGEFDITHTINMKDTFEILQAKIFDAIISDLNLPDSFGLNTLKEIKKCSGDTPIIIHSSIHDRDLTIDAIRYGAQDYILKGNYQGDLIYRILLFSIERKKLSKELEESRVLLQNQAKELERLNNDLVELNRNKDKFYSIVAHDLLNPFNNLLSSANLLAESFESFTFEEQKEFITKINNQAVKISTLIKNLLHWTALSTGRMEFNTETIDLSRLLRDLIDFHHFHAAEKRIELVLNNQDNARIEGDKFMVETVFRNLITNAIKFTEAGGKITVNCFVEDGSVKVEIIDTGIGISEEDMKTLFSMDRSRSKKSNYLETGTGLGLILSKDFVAKNKGKIEVSSEVNKGTAFKVIFPGIESNSKSH